MRGSQLRVVRRVPLSALIPLGSNYPDCRLRGTPQVSRTQRLIAVLVLNLGLIAALVTVGITAHSLAVLAEGSDYLLDAAGAGVALLAIRLSARPASRARPQGHPNATSIAALINGGWLLVLELLVATAAADRLITGTPQVDG